MPNGRRLAIVGAGFSGAVVAHKLAEAGHHVDVYESRDHLGGNCHTERDAKTGILIHKYGPHIFHTDSERVWNFVNGFGEFINFVNRVKTTVKGQVYSLPVNLHTINQFYSQALGPKDAERLIQTLSVKLSYEPRSFEEQALNFVGKELYEAFFKSYTIKQWGVNPQDLPASILKRLPLRFTYDDNYFSHKNQGIPRNGYTDVVRNILDSKRISVSLNTEFSKADLNKYDHIFYTGPIDAWFDFEEGELGYRTLDFVREDHVGDYQGCAVMNYGDIDVPYTRITEHKHFSPWEQHSDTIIFKEYSRNHEKGDIPYYPIRLVNDKKLLATYLNKAAKEKHVSFLGRLGTYRYLDMDVTVGEALDAGEKSIQCLARNEPIPSIFVQAL